MRSMVRNIQAQHRADNEKIKKKNNGVNSSLLKDITAEILAAAVLRAEQWVKGDSYFTSSRKIRGENELDKSNQ